MIQIHIKYMIFFPGYFTYHADANMLSLTPMTLLPTTEGNGPMRNSAYCCTMLKPLSLVDTFFYKNSFRKKKDIYHSLDRSKLMYMNGSSIRIYYPPVHSN